MWKQKRREHRNHYNLLLFGNFGCLLGASPSLGVLEEDEEGVVDRRQTADLNNPNLDGGAVSLRGRASGKATHSPHHPESQNNL